MDCRKGWQALASVPLTGGITGWPVYHEEGEAMAIEGASTTRSISPRERYEGLNHIAELRAKVFGHNVESELERFIEDMSDPRDANNKQN